MAKKISFMSWVLQEPLEVFKKARKEQNRTNRRIENTLSALTDAVNDLKVAVTDVAARVDGKVAPLVEAVNNLNGLLATERQAAADLAAAEDAEDVAQNQALADAQAATDAAVAEAGNAAASIQEDVNRLNEIAATETPAEEPVDETPVEEPVDETPGPVEEPVEEQPVEEPVVEEPVVEEPVEEPVLEPAPEDEQNA